MVTESAMRKASNAQAIAEATTTGAAITNAMAPRQRQPVLPLWVLLHGVWQQWQ